MHTWHVRDKSSAADLTRANVCVSSTNPSYFPSKRRAGGQWCVRLAVARAAGGRGSVRGGAGTLALGRGRLCLPAEAALPHVGLSDDPGVAQAVGEVAALPALPGKPLPHDGRHLGYPVALQQ